jgi:uncharacterized membrane protein
MTTEERLSSLHARMEIRQRAKQRRETGMSGAVCAALAMCLLFLLYESSGTHPSGGPDMYCGSTMLFEDAGGYVLVAVIAFMIGVLVTVVLKRRRKKKEKQEQNAEEIWLEGGDKP